MHLVPGDWPGLDELSLRQGQVNPDRFPVSRILRRVRLVFRRRICGARCQRRQAGRSSDAGADQIRLRDHSQNRERARHQDLRQSVVAGRRGIEQSNCFAAVADNRSWDLSATLHSHDFAWRMANDGHMGAADPVA